MKEKVYCFCPDGIIIGYKNYDSLLNSFEVPKERFANESRYFPRESDDFDLIAFALQDYRFCTANGHVIKIETIIDHLRDLHYIERQKFLCAKNGYIFRQTPAPKVRCRRGGGGWLRYPKTTQEKRWSDAWADEGIRVRPRRNKANLPDAWDDITRSDVGAKSWKRYRKHQWRVK